MKKVLLTVTLLMLTIACCIAFAACGHEHTFASEWSKDGENHWHACTGDDCNEISDKAAHVYDNACDADCNVCGATRTPAEQHVYDGEADAECNVCGATRELPVRYKANDEAEWSSAVDFEGKTQFTLVADMGTQSVTVVRDGDVLWVVGYKNDEKVGEMFYVKSGEAYYLINLLEGSVYEREDITKKLYDAMFEDCVRSVTGGKSYADFKYDDESHKYESDGNVHTLTFVGGTVNKIEATVKISSMTVTTQITFAADKITVPESHVFKIDAESYENALNFKDADGKFYQNVDVDYNGFRYIVTENAAYYYNGATTPDILETIWTNENGKGVIYTKKTKDSEWVRTVQTEKFDDFASLVLSKTSFKEYVTRIPFAQLTYSETDKKYSGSYKYGSNTINASMHFEDGKLVEFIKSMVKADGTTASWGGTATVTYGNAEIEIPTAAKTVYDVAYDEVSNAYTLENVSFSAGETKCFVFDVTKAIYDANKGESGNYDIEGAFTVSDGSATLTVTAKDASGNAVTNGGKDNGKIFFEELSTAGKYYVEITADNACTGSWSISFG